jgi:multiple sugar transport system permease protein
MRRPLSPLAATLRHILLVLGGVVVLAPFVWMLSTSLKPPAEIFSTTLRLLPEQWYAVENYRQAFTRVPLLRFMLNGVLVTAAIFALQAAIALPGAYALAKLRFRGANLLFALILLGLLIPTQVRAIPLYLMLHHGQLLDTYAALILPFVASPFGLFLLRQFFKGVPDDLIHAARLDGLGELTIVWRIMLPAALPALLSFGIFSVVWHWNDYFWPLLVVSSQELATPPLGTAFFRNAEAGHDVGPLMAGTVVITAPLVLGFLVAQRRFIEGLTFTGIKGH